MDGNYHELIRMDAALQIVVRSRNDLASGNVPKARFVPIGQKYVPIEQLGHLCPQGTWGMREFRFDVNRVKVAEESTEKRPRKALISIREPY